MKINLIVSLDTECDKGPKWLVRQPLQFTNITQGVPDRLQPLFERLGIKPTYLLSPEILRDEASMRVFGALKGQVELGTHLHAEFIEPQANFQSDNTSAFQSDFAPEIEKEKLINLTGLFKERLGYDPISFRAGRYGISSHTLKFLDDLGYRVDSSVTPGMWWWRSRGKGVNFLGAPGQPYHPSANDFRKPGHMNILEVPVTLINPFWDKFPISFLRAINPLHRPQTVLINTLFKKRVPCAWLRPTFSTAEKMMEVTDYLAKKSGSDRIFLVMLFHSNEATADMSPYFATKEDVNAFLEKMVGFFSLVTSKYEVEPIGLGEAAGVFESAFR